MQELNAIALKSYMIHHKYKQFTKVLSYDQFTESEHQAVGSIISCRELYGTGTVPNPRADTA